MAHICEQLVDAASYLQRQGMPVELLRKLHHPQKRPEQFAYTLKYFSQNKNLGALNRAYADRVLFVADEHRKGRGSFEKLVAGALRQWPL